VKDDYGCDKNVDAQFLREHGQPSRRCSMASHYLHQATDPIVDKPSQKRKFRAADKTKNYWDD
jgi:hypothetical protein